MVEVSGIYWVNNEVNASIGQSAVSLTYDKDKKKGVLHIWVQISKDGAAGHYYGWIPYRVPKNENWILKKLSYGGTYSGTNVGGFHWCQLCVGENWEGAKVTGKGVVRTRRICWGDDCSGNGSDMAAVNELDLNDFKVDAGDTLWFRIQCYDNGTGTSIYHNYELLFDVEEV